MNKINKMSIENIIEKIGIVLKNNDIIYLCENDEIIKEYVNMDLSSDDRKEKIKEFFIKYEEYINKEKLVLLTIINLQNNIEMLEEELNTIRNGGQNVDMTSIFAKISSIRIQSHTYQTILKNAMNIGKGMETFLTFYYYDEEKKEYQIDVVDSQEIIEGKKNRNVNKNKKRFEEVDLYFKGEDESSETGLEFVLQSILLTDLYQVFPDAQFGDDIRTMILENEILRNGIKTEKEIRELKTFDNIQEYMELIDNVDFADMMYTIKDTLKEYAGYLDMDKLLLISAYRFYDGIENKKIDLDKSQSLKELLEGIATMISNQTKSISCELQKLNSDGNYENYNVDFSKKDLMDCIGRFTSNSYLTKDEIQEYRNKIEIGELNLSQISLEITDILFSQQEIENLAMKSEENLVYAAINYEWDSEKTLSLIKNISLNDNKTIEELIENNIINLKDVIELYKQGNISLEMILNLKENIKFEETINSNELIKYYKESIQKEAKDEDKELAEKYLELYKNVMINEKENEEKEIISNELIQEIIEQIDDKNYKDIIFDYYIKGIITLNSIADWYENDLIEEMYEQKLITLEDLIQLGKLGKISYQLLSNKYSQLVENESIEYEERLRHIRSGFISEECILELYRKNLIFESDLTNLSNDGFVKREKAENEIKTRTIEELESHSSIKLRGLNNLTKINNDIYSDGNEYNNLREETKKIKLIIDPNERENFIRLIGGYRVLETDIEEESPFYNYEFYVIPDERGEVGPDSVIIAERYYEDKETEMKFATNNATYFFKYKDLMVLSNLEKSEMTKEKILYLQQGI